MSAEHLKAASYLVVGLGESGFSALRWLHRAGARVAAIDSRESPPYRQQAEALGVPVILGGFDEAALEGVQVLVVSPGIPYTTPFLQAARARGAELTTDVGLFARMRPKSAKIIGITGSNGKSTVTELVGEMCRQADLETVVAGNIGLPVLDAMEAAPGADIFVLELSSFQLKLTPALDLDAATVLNISEDHLDWHPDMADYRRSKLRIFERAGRCVYNLDEMPEVAALPELGPSLTPQGMPRWQGFSLRAPAKGQYGLVEEAGNRYLARGDTLLLDVDDLRLPGLHNAANALAALALGDAVHLPMPTMLQALRNFSGLRHRVEYVRQLGGVTYYDDSKGTNVGATVAAVAGLPMKSVLIAGGDGKGQDFSPLRDAVATHARAVILIGRDAPQIADALANVSVPVVRAASLEEAVSLAADLAQPGDAVLLSPACASWDMFNGYAHRAQVFIDAVMALTSKEAA